jgi:hypothetical protein
MKAKDLIKLAEEDDKKDKNPDLSKAMDDAGWVTHWSGNLVEYECPNYEDGRLQVFDFGSWHWMVKGVVVNSGNTHQSLAAFVRENFGLNLGKVEKPEESFRKRVIKESLAGDVEKIMDEIVTAMETEYKDDEKLAEALDYLEQARDIISKKKL